MSDAELVGNAIIRFKDAKESFSKKQAEAMHLANIYSQLVAFLPHGMLPQIDLERELPTYPQLIQFRDTFEQAKRQLADAREQLDRLGINAEMLKN